MRILIAGCGYVGTAFGEEMSKSGHEVWGLRRDAHALRAVESKGIRPFPADLLSPSTLKGLPAVDAVLFSQAPSRKSDSYPSTYVEGTSNLLSAMPASVRKIVHISSTSVYAANDGSWVDESTDLAATAHADRETGDNAKHLLKAEATVLAAAPTACVLRLTGIYGEGRNRVKSILEGRIPAVLSDVWMNRIHIADIVRAIKLLMEKGERGIYLGTDDRPTTQREFYTWMFKQLGMPLPEGGEGRPVMSNKRVSNKKIKALGLKLRYPTFVEGYAPIIEAIRARA
jgi:nucleoside-diphosphate-sugar epimerase